MTQFKNLTKDEQIKQIRKTLGEIIVLKLYFPETQQNELKEFFLREMFDVLMGNDSDKIFTCIASLNKYIDCYSEEYIKNLKESQLNDLLFQALDNMFKDYKHFVDKKQLKN